MLREIQRRAYVELQKEFKKGMRRILLCAQTGFGKTVLLAFIVASHISRGGRAVVFVHRRELLTQTVRKLRDQGVERVGMIGSGEPEDADAPVQVVMVQTMLARRSFPAASLVILDEAHHYVADEWGAIAEHYKAAIVLGFTATPERSDGTPLGDIFESMLVAATFRELIDLGFLTPIDVIAPDRKTRTLCTEPVEAYLAHGDGRKAVLFAATVKDARDIAERFTAADTPAACVDGDIPASERERILSRFERGDLRVITNVYCLTEGWDCPSVEVVILARACGSPATYLQIVGRVLRPFPGKTSARLIDLRGVVHEHGMPDAERTFSLEGKPISTGEAPLKTCPSCARTVAIAARVCECGHAFPVASCVPDPAPLSKIERTNQEREFFVEMLAQARMRGFKPGWAAHKFTEKFGRFPAKYWREFFPRAEVAA